MISIKNLAVQYDKHIVLQHLNLNISSAITHGILGLNGSGKTTLFNAIYGLLKISDGEILFGGNALPKTIISFLESELYFFSNITAREFLMLFENKNNIDIEQLAVILHLPLDELIENYSHGMKKKLALLSLLPQNKPLLMLDEPFNGLDLQSVETLKQIILKLKQQQKTMVISSHIIETLFETCDVIHYLNEGKIEQSFARENYNQISETILKKLNDNTANKLNSIFDTKV
jgi:ABC-2 type transport system ATP-binding protein